ncbi:two-component system QseEF-associated lipoprotein QseG [Shimwellia pseudoproteus]|uniref:two-component system QseEF-associated lipoprotein QseG n=1 Tax=Shimwellia pseudoproteus TaxID=570012 RepID=UPI0018ECE1F6|nr:two-component system QseEF-associated lipoprotein QseG [Shimwellia pseudoproteus]MBJ3815695.1 two-component system QseEF-associated lipoprotein QseG [Shimwellia pseudoproteus]
MTPIFSVLSRLQLAWQRVITVGATVAVSLLVTGCTSGGVHSLVNVKNETPQPERQLDDYFTIGCTNIWQLEGPGAEANPLYWLRAMDCARGLSPAEARVIAHRHENDTWQEAFRRGILLADARITPQERQRYMTVLDATSASIPPPVQSLYRVWLSSQQLQMKLVAERGRYNKLRQTTDTELEGLHQQQTHLQAQLETTTRKLQNLTDVERQLSTRKPATSYPPDSGHSGKVSDADSAADSIAPTGDSHSVKEKP